MQKEITHNVNYKKLLKNQFDFVLEGDFMYKSLFNDVPISILFLDFNGKILNANNFFIDAFGYSLSFLNSISFLDLFENGSEYEEINKILEKSDNIKNFETKLKKYDLSFVDVSVQFDKINFEDKNFIRVIITDVTDKKMMEKKLLGSYKHLAVINRQISILLDLNRRTGGKSVNEIIDFVLESALSLTGCLTVSLYKINGENYENISSYSNKKFDRLVLNSLKKGDLKTFDDIISLGERKHVISERFSDLEKSKIGLTKKNHDLLILPLKSDGKVRGLIVMVFENIHSLTTQELGFYEAFAMQAYIVLKSINII